MKQGKSLMELGVELQRQRNNRQDFIADTKSLEVKTDSKGNSQMVFHLDDNINTWLVKTPELAGFAFSTKLFVPSSPIATVVLIISNFVPLFCR